MITPLKMTILGFSREIVLLRSGNMNKTNTTKETRRKAKKRLVR